MKRKVAVLMRPAAVIGRLLRRLRTGKDAANSGESKEKAGAAGPAAGAPEKRVGERRKGYVHGGEKKMRDPKNRRRRV